MILLNLVDIPGTQAEKEATVRRILGLPERTDDRCGKVHHYSVILGDDDAGAGVPLHDFQAPCSRDDEAGNLRAVIQALRETADELEAGHADILTEEEDTDKPEEAPAFTGVCPQHGAWINPGANECTQGYHGTEEG